MKIELHCSSLVRVVNIVDKKIWIKNLNQLCTQTQHVYYHSKRGSLRLTYTVEAADAAAPLSSGLGVISATADGQRLQRNLIKMHDEK